MIRKYRLTAILEATLLLFLSGCESDKKIETDMMGLPELRSFDSTSAAAGKTFLFDEWPGDGLLPELAVRNLSIIWGTGALDEDDYWLEFEHRYGFFRPTGAELPLGFHDAGGGNLTLSCLGCHADKGPDNDPIIGVGNRRLDFRRLITDLETLADLAGQETPTIPENLQASPGAIDAVALGVTLAGGDQGHGYGYQQAPAWWTHRFKNRNFSDGSGHVENWRTMMATLMVFGWTEAEMETHDESFKDLQEYIYSLESPAWPFDLPNEDKVTRGQSIFQENCSLCHGTYQGEGRAFPEVIVDVDDVGTDRIRAINFGETEIDLINESWFAEPSEFEYTGGYLAPPLIGVWATAPYFSQWQCPEFRSCA